MYFLHPHAAARSGGMVALQKRDAQRPEIVQPVDDQERQRQAVRLWTSQICLSI